MAMLQRMGCDVVAAEGGGAALQAWAQQTFDLILMDIQMPDMDGLEATRQIRTLEGQKARAPVPIVALTANALGADRQAALAAGMNDYLQKPMTYGTLLGMVSRWVESAAANGPERTGSSSMGTDAVDLAAIRQLPGTQGSLTSPKAALYVGLFLEESRRQLGRLGMVLAAGDGEAAWRECHRLKSAASTMGALELARLARELESICRAGSQSPMVHAYSRQLDQALRCYHETVRVVGVQVPPPLDL